MPPLPSIFPLVEQTGWEQASRIILASPLLDEQYLFRKMGIRRDDFAEFTEVYWKIPRSERPSLSPFFDISWYLTENLDVRGTALDAFAHFCRHGIYENRPPNPFTNITYLKDKYHSLFESADMQYFLVKCLSSDHCNPSPYVDMNFYNESITKGRHPSKGLFRHFLEESDHNVVIPNKYFDVRFYRERYSDAPPGRRSAFAHFITIGDRQRRFPSSQFDAEWYLRENPDVEAANYSPFYHFMKWGREEGRAPIGRQTFGGNVQRDEVDREGAVVEFQLDLSGSRARYEAVRADVTDRFRAKVGALVERDARPVVISDLDAALANLRFPRHSHPKVSIIIPCYNEFKLTVECLVAIAESKISSSIEIIIADDCSPDPDMGRLAKIGGVIFLRQEKNQNFLRNCNSAFRKARGDYVFLLNNDAQVCEGAIDALVRALDEDESVGAVGPKILYPNGRLQEAGCAVNRDGETVMVGVGENPNEPCYNYSRDVHYISGAALLFRRHLAREELFDDSLAPAYCEDLDLCLDIHQKGYRIRYIANAQVVHHLSMTMSDHGKKIRTIRLNQEKILGKWGNMLARENEVKVISFYLPQFHPIPENNLWWGTGFTEWTNVSKALPSYDGHYQPHLPADLGFYDLRLIDVYQQQLRLIQRYGLGGICLYYYNFGGKPFLGKPLEIILENADLDIPFCLCWANENWSRRWDGGARDLLLEQLYDQETLSALGRDVVRAAHDPRYIRVNGKPLVLVYRPLMIPDTAAVVGFLRQVAKSAGHELHLVFVESMESIDSGAKPLELGFDASVEFPPQGLGVAASVETRVLKAGWKGRRYDYEKAIPAAIHRPTVAWPRYPAVFPSWDNTPRQPLFGTSFDKCSPEAFQVYAEEKIERCKSLHTGDNRLVFVNAWNEWAEGAHLEPDQAFGHRWLEALRGGLLRAGCI